MTVCPNDDDEKEANQRMFVSPFVTIRCKATAYEPVSFEEDTPPVCSWHRVPCAYQNCTGEEPVCGRVDHPAGEMISG